MYIICILYVYYMYIYCILYVYYMYIICILYVYYMHIICILYVYYMYIICILYVYYMYIICILYVYYMHIICILYVYYMYIICILYNISCLFMQFHHPLPVVSTWHHSISKCKLLNSIPASRVFDQISHFPPSSCFSTFISCSIKKVVDLHHLFGGFNPSEKYSSNISSFPNSSGWKYNLKIFQNPPPAASCDFPSGYSPRKLQHTPRAHPR